MFNFFRRQKPKEDKTNEHGSKHSKDVSKTVLPIRLFKSNDEAKKSKKDTSNPTETPENGRIKKITQEPETSPSATGNSLDATSSKFTFSTPKNSPDSIETVSTPQKNSPDSTEILFAKKAPDTSLKPFETLQKGVLTEVCDTQPTKPFAFSKSSVDSSRLAFFENLLEPKKGEPEPITVNSSAFNPNVDANSTKTHATCKRGSTASINTSADFSAAQTVGPGAVFCDNSVVETNDAPKNNGNNLKTLAFSDNSESCNVPSRSKSSYSSSRNSEIRVQKDEKVFYSEKRDDLSSVALNESLGGEVRGESAIKSSPSRSSREDLFDFDSFENPPNAEGAQEPCGVKPSSCDKTRECPGNNFSPEGKSSKLKESDLDGGAEVGSSNGFCDKRIPTIVVEDLDLEMGSSLSSLSESNDRERCGADRTCDVMPVCEGVTENPELGGECGISEEQGEDGKCDGVEKCEGNVKCDGSDESEASDEKSDADLQTEDFISGTDEEKEDGVDIFDSVPENEKNDALNEQRLNVVNKESSVQDRLHELTTELANREAETIQLRYQLEEAQKQLLNKTWGMDRLQNELLTSHQESESVKERLRSLENDLNSYQEKDSNFNEDTYHKKTGNENGGLYSCSNCDKFERTLDALNRRVRELEEELSNVKRERDKLEEEANSWEAEREQEIKIVQQTLADAEREKTEMRMRFEKEFEALRTVNTDREQHLLDDFEWKLREVEQACKKRLLTREQVVREQCLEEQIKLKDQIQELETKMKLHHSHEAELSQLRGLSNEQQRSLKVATRQVEQLQNSEKSLKEEIEKLKSLVQKEKSHLATMQGIHNREIAEKERKFQFKLDQYKSEVNAQVDEKVQRECARLRIELDRQHKEERRADLESAKQEMEKDMHLKKQNWDRRMQECIKELDILQRKLVNKDKEYKQELENIQTISDRDIMELRRKLDKMDMSYQEKLEKVQEKCDKEIERINAEWKKRILSSEEEAERAKATLEGLEAEREQEAEDRLAEARAAFEERLQEERRQLLREKEEALALAELRHRTTVDNLRNQLDSIYKSRNHSGNVPQGPQDSLMHLHQELSITSESSATDEGCIRERIQASEDESICLQSQEEEDQLSPLPQVDTNKRLDENRERTGNTEVLQTRSSRRKRRSRAARAQQRAKTNMSFAPA